MPIWGGTGITPEQQKQLEDYLKKHPEYVRPQTAFIPRPGTFQPSKTQIDQIVNAPSLDDAQKLAKNWGLPDERLANILKDSWLPDYKPETVFTEEWLPSGGATIPITQAELSEIQRAEASGTCVGTMKAHFTVKTYTVTLRDGSKIYVEALSQQSAEDKARDKGYDVAWVTWSPASTKEKETVEEAISTPEVFEGNVKLATGEWVPKNMYDQLSSEQKVKLNQLGVDGFNEAMVAEVGDIAQSTGNQYLIDAFDSGGVDGYNKAIGEYNTVIKDIHFLNLYNSYVNTKDWGWFEDTFKNKLNDKGYMAYIQSDKFRDKYATVMQPSGMPNDRYNLIRGFISPSGFDSQAAFDAGKESPSTAAQIITASNQYLALTASDETKAKLNSGEWTLLPYGQVVETKNLEQMPPTYKQIVETSGLVGLTNYQEKVHEWNQEQGAFWNIIDSIGANAVRLGQDIKNFAILQLSMSRPEVKEGDPRPEVVGTRFIWQKGPGTFTAEEAVAYNQEQSARQEYYKKLYDDAEMAAQEWSASRPYLQAVYPAGFLDSVKENPAALKDPTLWGETIAATLPYTVATGLIVGSAAFGGPAGVALMSPLAFGITLSVEGNDIYKDAIAAGASHDQALKLANVYGSISASIETLGDTIFVGALGFASGAFSKSLGQNTAGNIIRGAAKQYGWKTLTTDMIKDFVNQGGQEFFQEVVHNAAVKTVDENQALLDNAANAFVSGVIGTAPFTLWGGASQAIHGRHKAAPEVVVGADGKPITPQITPQMQFAILNKVFAPVSGFTVNTKTVGAELAEGTPAQIAFQKQQIKEGGKKTYEAGNSITIGLVDKKTIVTGQDKVAETDVAYQEMMSLVNEYAALSLTLKQTQKAIADYGLAKSKTQLDRLEAYKAREKELLQQLKDLKEPMVNSVKNWSETLLRNWSGGEMKEQQDDIRKMAKTIVADIDAVTSQLFGERTALEVAKDVRELEGQIKVIEEEMAKGMLREQLEGYGRLLAVLNGQVNDLVEEARRRYLSEGEKVDPKTKKLVMETMSLQARLVQAIENLYRFHGSTLEYTAVKPEDLGKVHLKIDKSLNKLVALVAKTFGLRTVRVVGTRMLGHKQARGVYRWRTDYIGISKKLNRDTMRDQILTILHELVHANYTADVIVFNPDSVIYEQITPNEFDALVAKGKDNMLEVNGHIEELFTIRKVANLYGETDNTYMAPLMKRLSELIGRDNATKLKDIVYAAADAHTGGKKVSFNEIYDATLKGIVDDINEARAEEAASIAGTVLDYPSYRRGELAVGAEVVKLERDTFEAIQKTTMAMWGKESYASVLEELNRRLSEIVSLMDSLQSKKKATKAIFDIYEAIRNHDTKKLKAGVKLLELEAGKIKDAPLQLAALQEVKLLDTLTMENFWKRWENQTVKKTGKEDVVWYTSDDMADAQAAQIKRQAETIVQDRFDKLMERAPQLLKLSKDMEEIMEWMEREYDKEYFEVMHGGEFEDIHDYLDVDREIARIRMEVERQEEIEALRHDLETKEREKDIARDLRDKAENRARKDALDDNVTQRERDIKETEKKLQTITKTKLVIPAEKVVTEEEREKMKVAKVEEGKEEALTPEEQAEIERKAAQRIRIAKQEIMNEGKKQDKQEEKRESAFPGIRPKTARDRELEREGIGMEMDEFFARMTAAQALQMLEGEIGMGKAGIFTDTDVQTATRAGIYAFTKAQTRELTQTQTLTSARLAVRTALELQLQTKTKTELELVTETKLEQQLQTVTEIITNEIIHTGTIIKPPRMRGGESKKGLKLPEGSIAWRQGIFWKYIPPPWAQEKPITLKYPPKGAKLGGKTPKETIQMIGEPKAKVPKDVSIDLGVVDIYIRDYGRKIEFKGEGLRTSVGSSLVGTTKGMSIPAGGRMFIKKKTKSRRNDKVEAAVST